MSWSIYASGRKAQVREAVENHKAAHLESQPEEKADYEAAKALALLSLDNNPAPIVKVEMSGSRCVGHSPSSANLKVQVESVHLLGIE